MVSVDNLDITVDEISYEGEFTALLYENGIVELVWDKKIKIITLTTLKNVKASLLHFGHGKRMPVYVSTFAFMETSAEAQRYAGTPEAQEYTVANAVQIDNLAKKIMFNFFIRFYGSSTPSRAFSDKEAAFKWLLSLVD